MGWPRPEAGCCATGIWTQPTRELSAEVLAYQITRSNFVPVFLIAVNPLNAKLNPICHLLALLGALHFLHINRVRVNKSLQENTRISVLIDNEPQPFNFTFSTTSHNHHQSRRHLNCGVETGLINKRSSLSLPQPSLALSSQVAVTHLFITTIPDTFI